MITKKISQMNYTLTDSNGKKLSKVKNWIALTAPARIVMKLNEINHREAVLVEQKLEIPEIKHGDLETGFDVSNFMKLNNAITKRKTTTLNMVKMPYFEFTGKNYEFTGGFKTTPGSRAIRMVADGTTISYSIRELTNANGDKIQFRTSSTCIELPQHETVYVDFVEASDKDEAQQRAHEMCIDFIKNGMMINGVHYSYALSSSAQMMELKGVFIRDDYRLPFKILNNVEDPLYKEFLDYLRGAEALLEVVSFGAFSCKFSNKFAKWLMEVKGMSAVEVCEKYKDIMVGNEPKSVAKWQARVGLSLTSSISLGRKWKVLHIGEVKFEWNDELEEKLRNIVYEREDGKILNKYTEKDIRTLKRFWKKHKYDGASIGRASTFCKRMNKLYKLNLQVKDISFQLVHFRWGGVKGTVLLLPDEVLDACVAPDGTHIYQGYDLIVEDNSWKYEPMIRFYNGAIAPEFEYINISKSRGTNYMSEQYVNALDELIDEYGYNPEATLEILKELIDENMAVHRKAVTDLTGSTMKAQLGMTDSERDGVLDQIGVKAYNMSLRSKLARIVDVICNAVKDPYCGGKYYDTFQPEQDRTAMGKLQVQGATKFLLTDFTCMLRTDLMVKNDDGLWDIVIDKLDQVAMTIPDTTFWAGKDCEALIFRSPCIHPGEPFRTYLQPLSAIQEVIHTAYGDIYPRDMFAQCKHIIIFTGWTNALEQLGGADIDGDKALCVTDPKIVRLRRYARPALFVKIDDEEVKCCITMDAIKDYMIRSLRNNGVGKITNYATTWRDIQHYAIYCLVYEEQLPGKIRKALKEARKAARLNIESGKGWIQDDPSLEPLAQLTTEKDENNIDQFDLEAVIKAIDAMLEQLRMLQEMAIHTPKSGIFVEFGCTDPDRNNYNHLTIEIRASWHQPDMDKSKTYNSKSPMGFAAKYAEEQWRKLKDEIRENSVSLFPNANSYYNADLMDVYKEVKELKATYGRTVKQISDQKRYGEIDKEEFGIYFEELTDFMHSELTALAVEHGVDKIAIMAYDASYQDGKKGTSGKSFVWHCFFEELLDTLALHKTKHFNEGEADVYDDTRLYPVIKDIEYIYESIEAGEIAITNNEVFKDDVKIGFCYKEDGTYNMISVNDRLYVEDDVELKTVEELTATLDDNTVIKVVGFKFYLDAIANDGSLMSREKLLEYLPSKTCQNMLRARVNTSKKSANKLMVELFIRSGKDEDGEPIWSPVGSMEREAVNLARVLNGKIFTVKYLDDSKDLDKNGEVYKTRLSLGIDKIVFDEFQVVEEECDEENYEEDEE